MLKNSFFLKKMAEFVNIYWCLLTENKKFKFVNVYCEEFNT